MKFLSRLFQRFSRQPGAEATRAQQLLDEAERVVQAYGNFLADYDLAPGCVADASKLPFEKLSIKAALTIALRISDDEEYRSALRIGYLGLAQWQDGVGEADQGVDLSKIPADVAPRDAAAMVAAMSEGYVRWVAVVTAEHELLAHELDAYGL